MQQVSPGSDLREHAKEFWKVVSSISSNVSETVKVAAGGWTSSIGDAEEGYDGVSLRNGSDGV